MDERDQQESAASSSRRGLIIALAALVIVVALGFLAYDALAGMAKSSQSAAVTAPAAAASQSGASASAGSASADPSAANGESASTNSDTATNPSDASAEQLPRLTDYDATVYTENGDARTLTQIADGKPLVINFWATWCPFCIEEMGDFQQIFNDYEGRVSFAFIDCVDGSRETVDDGAKWLFENGYTLPAYYDTTSEAVYSYGASALPTTVLVAANGDIMDITPGRIDATLVRDALDKLVEAAQGSAN